MFNTADYIHFINNCPAHYQSSLEKLLTDSTPTFSQNGEDIVIRTLLASRQQSKGLFIDIGAYHPFKFSNTFALYLAGWRGVNVDANDEAISEFNRLRPDDININTGVAENDMTLHLTKFEEGAYNTLNLTPQSLETAVIRSPVKSVTTLECIGINNLLAKYAANQQFDLLTVDIEGLDERVFKAIDFAKYRPFVIAIEIDHSVWTNYHFIHKLGEIGYEFYCQCGGTSILVRSRD